MAPHTTIFQFLTSPNPTVQQHTEMGKKDSQSNTTNKVYVNPVKVIEWAEMQDLRVLREAFGGTLFEEAHREGRELNLPKIRPSDRNVSDEKRAVSLFNKWNREIVMDALEPILETHGPLIWEQGENVAGVTLGARRPHPQKTRVQPTRASVPRTGTNKRLSLNRLEPDSGSIASCPDSAEEESQEKFLKEYKVAAKWKSSWIKERRVIDESGSWRGLRNSTAWPIMQTFTYCVKFLCRYGCILTCEELFLFRIRPLDENPGSEDPNLLRDSLANNGLLEYVSVPWSNHCQGDPKVYTKWTVNLILWYMHAIAKDNSDVRWTYLPLKEETALPPKHLRLQEQALARVRSISSQDPEKDSEDRDQSFTKGKRRREESDDQMSTEAENDETAARRKPKHKKRYNLRTKPTPSPRAGQ